MRFASAALALLLLKALVATTPAAAQEPLWARSMGGVWNDAPEAVATDAAGNVYTAGRFQGTFHVGGSSLSSGGQVDTFVTKLDASGSLVWAKQLRGANSSAVAEPRDVTVDGGGNVYLAGLFRETCDFDPGPGVYLLTAGGAGDAFVAKLGPGGDFLWARRFGGTQPNQNAYATGVRVDGNGNVVTVGAYSGDTDFDPGPGTRLLLAYGGYFDGFISKLDSGGSFVWAQPFGGTNSESLEGVTLDAGGHAFTVGYVQEHERSTLSKFDGTGQLLWSRTLGFTPNSVAGLALALDGSGNLYATGIFEGSPDFDPTPSGVFRLTSAGSFDGFVGKFDPAGNLLWARRMGGASTDRVTGVTVDGTGDVYAIGDFRGTATFDPGVGAFRFTSSGWEDAFIAKLDAAGNFLWAAPLGGTLPDAGTGLSVDRRGDVYVTGFFWDRADFDPGVGTLELQSRGSGDVFVVKLGTCGFSDRSVYGTLLFAPNCTRDASELVNGVYASRTLPLVRRPADRFFLSSLGHRFATVAVDDALFVNGADSGLGPYVPRTGVPPFFLGASITQSLVPLPAPELGSGLLPVGVGAALFELRDTDGVAYGNTAIYLVTDCGIYLDKSGSGIGFVTHDDQVAGLAPQFDLRYGRLSELRADRHFGRSACLGRLYDSPAIDALTNPPSGDGYYYLARGLSSCVAQGYGDSSMDPDPRDPLDAQPACP